MSTALAGLAGSPFIWLLALLAVGAVYADTRPTRRHYHYFRRLPSGVWVCATCPATRTRHGRITP